MIKPGDIVRGVHDVKLTLARNFPGPVGVGGFFEWGIAPDSPVLCLCVLPTEQEGCNWSLCASMDGLFKLGWIMTGAMRAA